MNAPFTALPSSLHTWTDAQIQQTKAEKREFLAEVFEQAKVGLDGRGNPRYDLMQAEALSGDSAERTEQVRALNADIDRLNNADREQLRPHPGHPTSRVIKADPASLLTLDQPLAPHFAASARSTSSKSHEKVRLGEFLLGIAGGELIAPRLSAATFAALRENTGPAGGYLVPELMVGNFLDEVRPAARVFEAGALTLPMRAAIVKLPGWDTAPKATWRGEGDAFADAGGTFRSRVLTAKSVAGELPLSIEFLEDAATDLPGATDIVEDSAVRAVAEAIDKAALIGKGADNEPLGLTGTSGLNEVSMGTNGAVPADYDKFLDSIFEVENDNFDPNAVLYAPRTANTLRKLTTGITSDKTKLVPPERFQELRRLLTTQVPVDQTQGSDTASSTAYFGQWNQMVIGLRPDIGVRVQIDPYTKGSTGEVVIRFNARADMVLLNKTAFNRLVGIKA